MSRKVEVIKIGREYHSGAAFIGFLSKVCFLKMGERLKIGWGAPVVPDPSPDRGYSIRANQLVFLNGPDF
jgi:hypothetical protein